MIFRNLILIILIISSVNAVGVIDSISFEIVVDNSLVNSSSMPGIIVQPQIEAFIMRKGEDMRNEENYLWKISDRELVSKLVTRKEEDSENFNNILSIAINMETENRENAVREVISMDREFISGFSKIDQTSQNRQVSEYLAYAEAPVIFEIEENSVEGLFGKKVSIEELMEDLWDSFTK